MMVAAKVEAMIEATGVRPQQYLTATIVPRVTLHRNPLLPPPELFQPMLNGPST